MFTSSTYAGVTDPRFFTVAEAILQSNTEANVACLSEPDPAANSTIWDQSGQPIHKNNIEVLLHFLSFSPRIAEGSYCLIFKEKRLVC